ncbi:glucose-6-phosphate exchanger SLC37A1 [Pteropus alecto]|uniref:glucose-6-phosphate exchanger SLC37A1 n=1 Tax=Pteropus alecto TaxID=9402 RepID=UPI000D5371D2|nr:glucose-6-phosphate exchanger SLC37A1 [Pteropus alecto]
MARLPAGIRFLVSFSRDQWYKAFIFILTFLLYASFHLSRKPISIVKGALHRYCAAVNDDEVRFDGQSQKASDSPPHQLPDNETDCGWAPFGQDNYQQLLGALDYSFLCAYAVGMYLSGIIGERLPIRYYLTFGMLASGAFTALFGLGYFYDIHSFGFYVVTQVVNGLVQTTGWPSVVTCLGNWFGKGSLQLASFECRPRHPGSRGTCSSCVSAVATVSLELERGLPGGLQGGFRHRRHLNRFTRSCKVRDLGAGGGRSRSAGAPLDLGGDPKDVACSSTPVASPAWSCLCSVRGEQSGCGATSHGGSLGMGRITAVWGRDFLPEGDRRLGTGHARRSGDILASPWADVTVWLRNGVKHSKSCENGVHRFRLQKQASPAQDPEVQCLLLADGKHSAHQSHVVILPGNGGSGMAAISFVGALKIPGVIEFSLCLLFAKLVSYTFLFWLPLYITNVDHLDVKKAGELSTLFDVGGIFGGILAGVISDRLKKRASTCGLMLLLAAPTLYVFSAVSRMGLEATVAMLLLSGALVSGPYALITTAVSADLGTHKSLKGNAHALATVTAIIDGTGSVGAALGPLLAGLLSPSGWTNVFYMLMFADACALLFLIRLIHKELSCPGSATTGDQVLFKEH